MSLCAQASIVKRDLDHPDGSVLRCNRWSCAYCQPFKQRHLKRLARAGNASVFITITSGPDTDPDNNIAAQKLVRAWRLLIKRAKRQFKLRHIPYIAVMEATKNGRPHIHILARLTWLPQQWISKTMADLADAPIVWIERVREKGKVAAYVAKYIGKDPHKFDGCKRYWRSLDWIEDRAAWEEEWGKHPGTWKLINAPIQVAAEMLMKHGYAITWTGNGHFLAEVCGPPIDERRAAEFWR